MGVHGRKARHIKQLLNAFMLFLKGEVSVAQDPAEREQGGERTPGKLGKRFPAFCPSMLQNEPSRFSALELQMY